MEKFFWVIKTERVLMLLLWRFITFNSLVIEEIKVLYSLLNKEELQNVEQVLL